MWGQMPSGIGEILRTRKRAAGSHPLPGCKSSQEGQREEGGGGADHSGVGVGQSPGDPRTDRRRQEPLRPQARTALPTSEEM